MNYFRFFDSPTIQKFDMRNLCACPYCNGDGAIFEGAWMKSNPNSYADYEEIWSDCEHCNGRGWADEFFSMAEFVRFLFPPVYEEEDEIPY